MLLKALTTDFMCEIPLILYVQTPAVDDIMAIRLCLRFLHGCYGFFPFKASSFTQLKTFVMVKGAILVLVCIFLHSLKLHACFWLRALFSLHSYLFLVSVQSVNGSVIP